jgi:heterodisulfide reductase subunit C
MIETVLLYLALAVFVAGSFYRISAWFRHDIRPDTPPTSPGARLGAALKGIAATVFSPKLFTLIRAFVMDGLLQVRLLQRSPYRWVMHICIYGGFMILLLFHALDSLITAELFSNYQSTANPWVFIRDFAGLLVIVGMVMAVRRRFFGPAPRPPSARADTVLIAILAVIMLSGIVLKASKITSHTSYLDMVDVYAATFDEEELNALEAFWVDQYHVVSPDVTGPFAPETLEAGEMLHEMACAECHAKPNWAFTSFAVAKAGKRYALQLDQMNFPGLIWWVHYLACMLGLAYVPFSKMFHFFTTPLSLATNAVFDKGRATPANLATKQLMELDACMHCGACTQACSVGATVAAVPNTFILPSEKIPAIRELAAGKVLTPDRLRLLQQGLHLCTSCNRCTEACPAGIQLTDLWAAVKETMLRKGVPEFLLLSPLSVHRGVTAGAALDTDGYREPLATALGAAGGGRLAEFRRDPQPLPVPGPEKVFALAGQWMQPEAYAACYRCMTCTSACPVVRDTPEEASKLGLLPHQIMYAVKLRQWDLIFDSRMLWDCVGCYQCQEQCPQSVQVADVLYVLKNQAISRALAGASADRKGVQ